MMQYRVDNSNTTHCNCCPSLYCIQLLTGSEELDSDEESGKDWSDLEEEARKGTAVC